MTSTTISTTIGTTITVTLLREVAAGDVEADVAAAVLRYTYPGVSVTMDDVVDAAESLRIIERDDHADSDRYSESAGYNSREKSHEAFVASHQDNLDYHLARMTTKTG